MAGQGDDPSRDDLEELEETMERAGRDDDRIQNVLRMAARSRPFYDRMMRNFRMIAVQNWEKDDYHQYQHYPGEFQLGVDPAGRPVGVTRRQLNEHMLVVGRTGAGKTTFFYTVMDMLNDRGIPFLVFDFKNDYRSLAADLDLTVVNWRDLKFTGRRRAVDAARCRRTGTGDGRPPPAGSYGSGGLSAETWLAVGFFNSNYSGLIDRYRGLVLDHLDFEEREVDAAADVADAIAEVVSQEDVALIVVEHMEVARTLRDDERSDRISNDDLRSYFAFMDIPVLTGVTTEFAAVALFEEEFDYTEAVNDYPIAVDVTPGEDVDEWDPEELSDEDDIRNYVRIEHSYKAHIEGSGSNGVTFHISD